MQHIPKHCQQTDVMACSPFQSRNRATHDRLVVEASRDLRDCDIIALAQYSMAPAAAEVAAATGRPVLTTPDSAVMKLKQLLGVAG